MVAARTGEWIPKTTLGKRVLEGQVTTLGQALDTGLPLREPEIVDILLPELEDEVLDVNMVQRMTDSGRRVNFAITVVIGNRDGFVGLGRARGGEVGPSIRKAIDDAKLHLVQVRRGCGSWECGCRRAHSLPLKVTGQSGSVRVTLKPAPQGVGLAVGDVAKSILRLAGITDAWGFSQGHTKSTVNYALATFDAIRHSSLAKVSAQQAETLRIHRGAEQVYVREPVGAEAEPTAAAPAAEDATPEAGDAATEAPEGPPGPRPKGTPKDEEPAEETGK